MSNKVRNFNTILKQLFAEADVIWSDDKVIDDNAQVTFSISAFDNGRETDKAIAQANGCKLSELKDLRKFRIAEGWVNDDRSLIITINVQVAKVLAGFSEQDFINVL